MATIDERYPRTPPGVRLYIFLYPIAVAVLLAWFSGRTWVWVAAIIICGLAWFAAVAMFIGNALRREGYEAAIEDQSDPVARLND